MPSIIDGWLKMPDDPMTDPEMARPPVGQAEHASSVAYGTWSFDWAVEPGENHESVDIVSFIANNHSSETAQLLPFEVNVTGFWLWLLSGQKLGWMGDPDRPMIALVSYEGGVGGVSGVEGRHQFSSPITGSHHIAITRTLQGDFQVFFDSTLIIEASDNSTTTSEKFVITSWVGDSAFDNIVVSNSIDSHYITVPAPAAPSFPTQEEETNLLELLPFAILVIVVTTIIIFFINLIIKQRKQGK
jgi:hypothetical protein